MSITTGKTVQKKHGWARHIVLFFLIIAGCVSYMDRTALAIVNTDIAKEFGLSYTSLGLVLSSFATIYMVCQIPAGLAADRIKARTLLTGCLVVWGVAQLLTAWASSAGMLVGARGLLALGEAPLFLVGTKIITAWYNNAERAVPIGLFNASSSLGQVLAPALLGLIAHQFGWRSMFCTLGGLCIVLGLAWGIFYQKPPAPKYEPVAKPKQTARQELTFLLAQRVSWVLAIGCASIIYLQWLYSAWLPTYFQTVRHLNAAQAGFLSSIPQLAGFFGSLSGGVIIKFLGKTGYTPSHACYQPLIISLLIAAMATAVVPLCPTTFLSLVSMAIALFATGIAMTGSWTLGTIVVAEDSIATMEAIQNVGGSLGGALSPLLTGFIIQHTGSFTLAMEAGSIITFVCACVYVVGSRLKNAPSDNCRLTKSIHG
ncbi:MFS transporter [Acetobacter okinawensis]|uniref:MFS transporter n=1 Tax=Acetobacter okinawensis TaxID=1076594 RepID=UPI000A37DC5F|nr:MFS transporter [Acetobacter okinawensis]